MSSIFDYWYQNPSPWIEQDNRKQRWSQAKTYHYSGVRKRQRNEQPNTKNRNHARCSVNFGLETQVYGFH